MVDDWTPDTLAMQEAAGKIELVHTCCDGTRISASTVPRSDLPERLSRLFNRDPKKTVRGLLAGDSSVCPPTGLRWVRDSSADANGGRPTDGTAFHHKALAEALASRVEFSEAEWQSFGVQASELRHDHYIASGGGYYRPASWKGCTHAEVACWLLTASKLSKNCVGDYLGRSDEDAKVILKAFVDALDFAPFEQFDEALRFFLSLFRLPGEAQQIDRIIEHFAMGYHAARPGTFSAGDTAYVLAFSIIMLNTDAHSAQIEHKMTLEQFLRNNQGIDCGGDLPDDMMTSLYHSIRANEIRMEQREYIASDKEGWLYKQGGRMKTWKKRYTILSGNVLYYFKSPKDSSPAGFVPLEGIVVRSLPDKMCFELRPAAGKDMKSARMTSDHKGAFKQGHHTSFLFKLQPSEGVSSSSAASHAELERWVSAVQEHAVAGQVRQAASSSAKRASLRGLFSVQLLCCSRRSAPAPDLDDLGEDAPEDFAAQDAPKPHAKSHPKSNHPKSNHPKSNPPKSNPPKSKASRPLKPTQIQIQIDAPEVTAQPLPGSSPPVSQRLT